MSGVSLPVSRPSGRALVIAAAAVRAGTVQALQGLGFTCGEADDPYAGMRELARRPGTYRAVVLSLTSVYREELSLIAAVRRRYAGTEVWLAHTDGRPGLLTEAMRLGADGIVADDGLHRLAVPAPVPAADAGHDRPSAAPTGPVAVPQMPHDDEDAHAVDEPAMDDEFSAGEPVLTADELRALLQEQPSFPPGADD